LAKIKTDTHRLRLGIGLFLLAWAIVPGMDVAAKYLIQLGYPVLLVVWARFFFNALCLVPILVLSRQPLQFRQHFGLQFIRTVMLIAATLGFFIGLRTMGVADVLAVYFVYPFIVTLLSPVFLGERVGRRRLSAVAVGLLGSLMIIRPGFGMMDPNVGYVLAASVFFATYNLLTRKLVGRTGSWQTLGFQSIVGAVLMSGIAPFVWRTPDLQGLSLFAVIGGLSTVGHFLLIRAYDYSPASVLAPFSYFEIISATILGYLVFGDFPEPMTWAGILVIVASGIYIGIRESKAQ